MAAVGCSEQESRGLVRGKGLDWGLAGGLSFSKFSLCKVFVWVLVDAPGFPRFNIFLEAWFVRGLG